jgi:hypothetical protein
MQDVVGVSSINGVADVRSISVGSEEGESVEVGKEKGVVHEV